MSHSCKTRTEGGSCKRASQCERWEVHQIVKEDCRVVRRHNDKKEVVAGLKEVGSDIAPEHSEQDRVVRYNEDPIFFNLIKIA